MKLLLTSGGLTNKIIKDEFLKLVGKTAPEISVAFINTAAYPDKNPDYLVEDINDLKSIGVTEIFQIDISEPKDVWENILKNSDVIWVEGGNTFYLLSEFRKAGLDKEFINFVNNKVFVGVSAGSILATPSIGVAGIEPGDLNDVGITDLSALGWVDFEISPHTPSEVSLENVEEYAQKTGRKLYAIDDNCAVLVIDDEVKIIGGGFSKEFN